MGYIMSDTSAETEKPIFEIIAFSVIGETSYLFRFHKVLFRGLNTMPCPVTVGFILSQDQAFPS